MELWFSRYSGDEVSTVDGSREMAPAWWGGVREAVVRMEERGRAAARRRRARCDREMSIVCSCVYPQVSID